MRWNEYDIVVSEGRITPLCWTWPYYHAGAVLPRASIVLNGNLLQWKDTISGVSKLNNCSWFEVALLHKWRSLNLNIFHGVSDRQGMQMYPQYKHFIVLDDIYTGVTTCFDIRIDKLIQTTFIWTPLASDHWATVHSNGQVQICNMIPIQFFSSTNFIDTLLVAYEAPACFVSLCNAIIKVADRWDLVPYPSIVSVYPLALAFNHQFS